ncbi:Hypothetical predicted protein, partial [Podarcis lilfordi]
NSLAPQGARAGDSPPRQVAARKGGGGGRREQAGDTRHPGPLHIPDLSHHPSFPSPFAAAATSTAWRERKREERWRTPASQPASPSRLPKFGGRCCRVRLRQGAPSRPGCPAVAVTARGSGQRPRRRGEGAPPPRLPRRSRAERILPPAGSLAA